MQRMEYRIKDVQIDHADGKSISGYVNVTERESETLYSQQRGKWFKEVMKKGVFDKALKENRSIPCLLEHNWDSVLAHTDNGTLELREDNVGLRFDAKINNEEVYEQIRSGAINSCSFGFKVKDQDFETINARLEKRYVHEIVLQEISLVKNPAYVGSVVESRNLEMALQEDAKTEVDVEDTAVVDVIEPAETNEEVLETEEVVEVIEQSEVEDEIVEVVEQVVVEDKTEEERAFGEVDTTQVKEVIQEVIEQKQDEMEFYENCEKSADEHKEWIKESAEEEIKMVEDTSIEYGLQALRLRIEIMKLKGVQNSL